MAKKSVPASQVQQANPELANTEHWLESAWKNCPLNAGLKFSLMAADRASKGARAVANVLQRDFLARIDLADCPDGLTYPLLENAEQDRLFVALQCLIDAAERELDRIREDRGECASRASKEKANV